MNLQLLRTNVLLSGQIKWNINITQYNGKLIVSHFNLTPLSDNIPFNYSNDTNILNYDHQYNIKKLWSEIKGYFWNSNENLNLKSSWPIITEEPIDSHFGDFESCPKRLKYTIYGKQFGYLVPIWLEKLENEKSLQFTIKIGNVINNSEFFITKTLDLKENNELPYNHIHNKFCRYFKNWLLYTNIFKGQYDVMEIKLKEGTAWMSGVDVSSGNFIKKDISNIVNNLISRERPLLEYDSMIINSFNNNNIILAQLFNFNICFDINDIIDEKLINEMLGQKIHINISSSIQDVNDSNNYENLPLRDIYSNFDFIPKEKLSGVKINSIFNSQKYPGETAPEEIKINKEKINVFSYLKDPQIVDFIQDNKITQNIIHWSLQDNPSYIFNVYNGFSGYYITDIYNDVSHTYGNSPDPGCVKNPNSNSPENVCWASWINISANCMNDILKLNNNWVDNEGNALTPPYMEIFEKASDITQNWVNNLKYKKTIKSISNNEITQFKIMLVHITDEISESELINNNRFKKFTNSNDLYWAIDPNGLNIIYIISQNMDSLTFGYVKNLLNAQKTYEDTIINYLSEMMQSIIEPELISFDKSLYIKTADGPSLNINELTYYKNNQANSAENYVLRYDGRIIPCFISIDDNYKNYIYYKDQISDIRSENVPSKLQSSVYARYIKSKYLPLYPSINYFGIKYIEENYDKNPEIKTSNGVQLLVPYIEGGHFNSSTSLILKPRVEFIFEFESNNDDYIKTLLYKSTREELYKLYNFPNTETMNYIMNLYTFKINYDYNYSKITDIDPQAWINNYIYNVILELK